MTRFLCTGDAHFGAGRGLYPERLAEQQAVWQQIIDLAAERECDAILFAGDAFHRNHPDDDERHAFMKPLVESSVPVLAINGNSHDWRGIGKRMAVETATIGNETLIVSTMPTILRIVDGHVTVPSVPGGVAVCTLPWAPVSRIVAEAGGGDRDDINAYAAELLVEAARGLRAQVDGTAVLLAHWSVSGAVTPTGLAVEPHIFREPVLSLGDLAGLDFDAICLGHIHTPGPFAGLLQPPVWYVGSPLPLDFSEGGVEHGCWLLELDGDLGAHIEFLPIESRPFRRWHAEGDDPYSWVVTMPETACRDAVVWLSIDATADQAQGIDVAKVRQTLLGAGAHYARVTVDVEPAARPARGVAISDDHGPAELLDQWLRQVAGVNGDEGARLVERGRTYLEGVS